MLRDWVGGLRWRLILVGLGLALLCAPARALDIAVAVSQRDGPYQAFADAFVGVAYRLPLAGCAKPAPVPGEPLDRGIPFHACSPVLSAKVFMRFIQP